MDELNNCRIPPPDFTMLSSSLVRRNAFFPNTAYLAVSVFSQPRKRPCCSRENERPTDIRAKFDAFSDLSLDRRSDWTGPADPVSNIRKLRLSSPHSTETALEKRLRTERVATQRWHHEFWARANQQFVEASKRYKQSLTGKEARCPDHMSKFYANHLNEWYRSHVEYNKVWYKKNARILWLSLLVNVEKFFAFVRGVR